MRAICSHELAFPLPARSLSARAMPPRHRARWTTLRRNLQRSYSVQRLLPKGRLTLIEPVSVPTVTPASSTNMAAAAKCAPMLAVGPTGTVRPKDGS